MKKFIPVLSGTRRLIDNYTHIQEGLIESLLAITKPFGDSFKLWGVEPTLSTVVISDDTVTWTAGAVVLAGEICLVDAGSVTKSNALQSFIFDEIDTYAAVDTITGQNTHLIRKATIIVVNTVPGGSLRYDGDYYQELITGKWTDNSYNASKYLTDTEPTVDWDISGATYMKVRYKVDYNTVTVNIYINDSDVTGGNTDYLSVVLPSGVKAKHNASGSAFITGKTASTCSIVAGSNTINISATDFTAITGSLVLVGASIVFELE